MLNQKKAESFLVNIQPDIVSVMPLFANNNLNVYKVMKLLGDGKNKNKTNVDFVLEQFHDPSLLIICDKKMQIEKKNQPIVVTFNGVAVYGSFLICSVTVDNSAFTPLTWGQVYSCLHQLMFVNKFEVHKPGYFPALGEPRQGTCHDAISSWLGVQDNTAN